MTSPQEIYSLGGGKPMLLKYELYTYYDWTWLQPGIGIMYMLGIYVSHVNDQHSILSSICASKSKSYVTLHQHLYSSTKTCLWAAWFAMSRDQLFVIPRYIQFPTLCTVYYLSSRLDSRPYASRLRPFRFIANAVWKSPAFPVVLSRFNFFVL